MLREISASGFQTSPEMNVANRLVPNIIPIGWIFLNQLIEQPNRLLKILHSLNQVATLRQPKSVAVVH